MPLWLIVRDVVTAIGGLILLVYFLYKLAIWARKKAKGAYILGAVLAPLMGFGNVSDPDFRIVNEAKQNKKREEDDGGDPPNDE